ncbi:MAG: trigger factor [Gammaproteobacteria bacterium]|nr:trigger factor [Gammaproteobacteria bacterium]MDH4256315.1 trigger factor [Gammaproteobacteria bacterium]
MTPMQVNVQSTGSLERRMEVSVPKEEIEEAIAERLKRVGRTAKLKGFRPGKAPIKVIRQQFGEQVRQEVLSDILQQSFTRAVAEARLTPAAGPRIEPISSAPGEDLKYRAVFEIFPEIALTAVEGLVVSRPVADVSESDIEAMVQNLREQRPSFDAVDRESREGDRVTMDFEGLIDGKAFEGSKGEDIAVLLGAGRMLKDFETGILGAKADETKQVAVRYPDEYHNKDLAGRTADFSVHVKKVEEKRLPPLDDAFCLEYGVTEGGLEQLLSEVADNMRRELAENVRSRLKQQVFDRFLEANPVDVPKALVEQQVRDMQMDTARRMGAKDAAQVPPAEPFIEPARRRVALGMLVNELVKTREIKIDRTRVETRLGELAATYPDPDAILKAYRQNPDAMRQVEGMVLEDQVVDYLLERAAVTDQPSTFKELMNFGA